uniref:Uncharacterized protein n=1 Tax=Anguilla anguilla TaxID=7936 RepID=A0A0E9PZ08_ANGAN
MDVAVTLSKRGQHCVPARGPPQ